MNTTNKPTRQLLLVAMERAGAAMADHLMRSMARPDLVRAWDRAYGDWQQARELTGESQPSQPVAVFDGYVDGWARIKWLGRELPVGTELYAAPVVAANATTKEQK